MTSPPDSAVSEEAASWLVRLHDRHRECTAQERQQFETWLAADPQHKREYEALLEVWTISGELAPTLEPISVEDDDPSAETSVAGVGHRSR